MRKNLVIFVSVTQFVLSIQTKILETITRGQNLVIVPFTSLFILGAGWDCGARNARMYFIDDFKNKRVGGWCAATSENQWLQVDLGTNRYITAVGTQGV